MALDKEKVNASQLQFGMFISELDRPWLDSPFMLQGFVLSSEEQMQTLKSLCAYVFVDRTKSIGDQFSAKAKLDVAIKREGGTVIIRSANAKAKPIPNAPKVMIKTDKGNKKTIKQSSFFEIITAIKNGNIKQTEEGIVFNVREQFSNTQQDLPAAIGASKPTKNQTQQSDSPLSFLKGLFANKKESLKTSVTRTDASKNESDFGNTESSKYIVTIYENEAPPVEQEIAIIYPTFEKSQIATKDLFQAIADEQHLDISTVSEILDTMVDSISRTPDALMWLAKLKDADNIAYSQALNVSINMMAFASFLALPKKQIKEMGLAGLLQDIGKAKIPKKILQKKSKLDTQEFEIAKTHISEGLKILSNTENVPLSVTEIIAEHHERYDGSGYPKMLSGYSISINGQIAGLVDTYCAITTDRSYAKSLHNMKALDALHQMRDKAFSSDLIDQLIQFLGIYPVSSLVELNTGEVAVVIQQNQVRRLQPRLMIILGPDKSKNKFPTTIDLLDSPSTPTGEFYKITKGIPSDSYGLNIDDLYL